MFLHQIIKKSLFLFLPYKLKAFQNIHLQRKVKVKSYHSQSKKTMCNSHASVECEPKSYSYLKLQPGYMPCFWRWFWKVWMAQPLLFWFWLFFFTLLAVWLQRWQLFGPLLWSRLKYLNKSWMDCHEISYKHSGSSK